MGRQRSQTTVPGGAQEERVAGYLLEHPGFFDRHPETLLKLELCRRTVGRVALARGTASGEAAGAQSRA